MLSNTAVIASTLASVVLTLLIACGEPSERQTAHELVEQSCSQGAGKRSAGSCCAPSSADGEVLDPRAVERVRSGAYIVGPARDHCGPGAGRVER